MAGQALAAAMDRWCEFSKTNGGTQLVQNPSNGKKGLEGCIRNALLACWAQCLECQVTCRTDTYGELRSNLTTNCGNASILLVLGHSAPARPLSLTAAPTSQNLLNRLHHSPPPPFLQAATHCCLPWPPSKAGTLPHPLSPHPLIPFLVPFFSGLPSVSCVPLSYLTSASPIGVPKSFSPSILS